MPASRRFDLIAFDWDGTLFDSTAAIVHSIQRAVRDVGGKAPSHERAAYVIGMSLRQALAHAAPDVPEHLHPELEARYRQHWFRAQEEVTLFAGVLPLLRALQECGCQLAVATGKSRVGLNSALVQAGLRQTFAATRTADETAGKPDPLMLHELMDELGTTPERTLMVGDTTHDLHMAHNAGCPSVAVAYGAHDPELFAQCQPLFIAHNVAQLHDWLMQQCGGE